MFEHVRNYDSLMNKIAQWLKPQGLLFIHHFCHHHLSYEFNADNSWMAKHFFQDGLMPSNDLLLHFQDHLSCIRQWSVNGKHYAKTCYCWLENLHAHKVDIIEIFTNHYDKPHLQYEYWELFIRACAQLFGYRNGHEWYVTHCLMQKGC